jgi:starch phosphorylase
MGLPTIKTKSRPDLEIPEIFNRLRDLAYNLWWAWSPRAHKLFNRLSPSIWQHYRNPVEVLIDIGPERWDALANDDEFAREYHALVEEFDAYVTPSGPTWFQREHGDRTGPYAYFSMEYGWHEALQFYSGGLGVLSGDHCKSASDLGLPLIGVGILYKHGYFKQTIDADGTQQHFYPDYDPYRLPLLPVVDRHGKELHVPVDFPDRKVQLRVWQATVGRVPVLMLDSDIPINHPADRQITSVLYVRGREMRLCQEYLLGLGGVAVLRALEIEPAVWHLNEGHSALLSIERIVRAMKTGGLSFDEARRVASKRAVFTTHTPVPAGNEQFDTGLVRKYVAPWAERNGVDVEDVMALGHPGANGDGDQFNLTAMALRTSARANGVSALHGEVANDMWRHLIEPSEMDRIEHITNGVHAPSWIGPELDDLLVRRGAIHGNGELLEPGFAEHVDRIPDHEIWSAHQAQKQRLVRLTREKTQLQGARHGMSPDELRAVEGLLDPEALTIGFARRFATYKRADLLLRDEARLHALITAADRPVQFLFAGKAHPADRPGQDLIRRICQAAADPKFAGHIVFLENYDMRIGRALVQGVDVWLNTPRRPHEASGTSGMKAAINGVLNWGVRRPMDSFMRRIQSTGRPCSLRP